nr:hypothetical protein [Tanacetum cinerariifolium]
MVNLTFLIRRSYALSWKPCQGDSLNLPDHRSVPADWSRSVPADWSRSVPAEWSRSVPAAWSRSVPADWSRSVPAYNLHTADYTQLYDFLKYNQKEVDELKAERLAKTQNPLALMANSNNPYVFPAPHQDQSSFNQNYLQQPMPNPEDITDPTTVMNMTLALMAKAFKLNYSTSTNNNQRISSNPRNRQIAQPGMNMGQDRQMQIVGGNGGNQFRQYAGQNAGNPAGYNDVIRNQNQNRNGNLVAARAEGNAAGQNGNQIRCYNCRGVGHYARNYIARPKRRDVAYLQTQLLIAQKEEAGIQLQAEEYDLMAAAADLDAIEEVNANCILMANLQQASTSEQYTELLEPIPESHQVPQNDNDVISEDTSVEQEIGSLLISIAAVVANPPPTAYHGGGKGWKSRRCCCGLGGVGGVVVTSGVDVAVAMGLLWWMVAGVRRWYDGDGSRRRMMMAEGWPNLCGGCCHGGAGGSGVIGGVSGA